MLRLRTAIAPSLLLFAVALALPACGARAALDETSTTTGADAPPVPLEVYVESDNGACVSKVDVANAEDALGPDSNDSYQIAVVEVFFAFECTGLGGDYVLARELVGSRTYWLGAHGCQFAGDPLPEDEKYGVLRYSQTAALFQIDPGVCVDFPGETDGVQTDSKARALATFATLADAQAFAASLPAP